MNLLLLKAAQIDAQGLARVEGRHLQHLKEILQLHPGERLRCGVIDGPQGSADLLEVNEQHALLRVSLDQDPPTPLPVKLVVALPRPKMLKRILQTSATLGVKEIYFINAYKVEKSFWASPWLQPEKIEENLLLGLEQAMDTRMPKVHLRKRFKPFVEDELPGIIAGTQSLVAHPGTATPCPVGLNAPVTLAIGPEGGFIAYEVKRLCELGFEAVNLGSRILRVETAVPVLLSRLFTDIG